MRKKKQVVELVDNGFKRQAQEQGIKGALCQHYPK